MSRMLARSFLFAISFLVPIAVVFSQSQVRILFITDFIKALAYPKQNFS